MQNMRYIYFTYTTSHDTLKLEKMQEGDLLKMNRSHAKYIAGLLLFGLNGVVSSQILLSSMNIVLFRTLLGSVFLMFLFAWQRQPLRLFAYPRQLAAVVLSGVSMGLSWIFLYEAYQRIGVGLSSIAYYCGPVIVMLLTPFVFHKTITGIQKLCFGVVFLGIVLISVPDLMGSAAVDSFGLFCGFASAVLHALMVIFTMKAPEITGLKNSMIQLVVSFLTVAVFAVALRNICPPSGLQQWGWMLVLGIVNTGIGCYLYFAEIAKLPVETVSILGYLEPLSAVVFAVILLHEHLNAYELVGAVLIACGAVVSERAQNLSKL